MHTNYENARMLDMIFENRNKAYGAYALRDDYNSRISQALLITFTCIVLLGFGKFISDKIGNHYTKNSGYVGEADPGLPIHLDPPVKVDPPKPPKPQPTGDPVTAIKSTTVKVVTDNTVVDSMPTVEQLKDVESGLKANSGENKIGVPDGEGKGKMVADEPAVIDEGPVTWADTMPEFPGGEEKLLAFLRDKTKFPDGEQGAGIEGKALVKFVVNEDGSISSVKVVKSDSPGFGREATRVVGLMPHFIPGSQSGRRVKVQMVLPFQFKLAD